MGADGGMSGPVSRGGSMSSSDLTPSLPQCLPLEPILLGNQKYTRSVELRRVLGFPLGSASEDHPFRVSSYKPSPPVATEELKHFKDNVVDASIKAKERSKMLCESIHKLDKFREAVVSKKRRRTEVLSNEKPGGSNLLKIAGQPSRNLLDHSAQRLDDKAKCVGVNKRSRTSAGDLRVDNRSGSLLKDQIDNEKDTNITKPVTRPPVQPEERIRQLSAVRDGWDKIKRRRSNGGVANRCNESDVKRSSHSKPSTDSKLASCDTFTSKSNVSQGISTGGPSAVIKGKISRAPRTGSVMAVNSSSDVQASSEACEGWEQPASTNKVLSLGLVQNQQRAATSSHKFGQWVGQRQQKSSRSRRTNLVSPVSNHDEGLSPSLSSVPPGIGAKNSLNGSSGCLDADNVHNNTSKSKMKVEIAPSPVRLSEGEDTRGLEHKVEEKGAGCNDVALNGKGKVRAFMFPTKRNKNLVNDNVIDGVRRQGRTMRGLSLSRSGVSQGEVKSENVSVMKPVQNTRPGSDKIKSKSGRPPSRKMLDGRTLTRTSDSDDDHEELLAAAASARKANYLSCSGRFWKKMEPVFGPVSLQDASYLKQQLSFAQGLEDSLSQIPDAGYKMLGIFTDKEKADISFAKQNCHSYQIADKDEGLTGESRLDKFSSLYQRVLSALIEEDECDGMYNGTEGLSMSFQCASDDSHCGSCNYADAETRDRDRLESEAESIIDFQYQKRCAGDRFSCNKSVTSNTTRNVSMSDSLYSSGRWLGDDCLSYSDVEFVSGSCYSDQVGVQPADATVPGTLSDCQYQLMCVDERLILELQSIGLYLDAMPDLAEGEVVIDRDITELKEGLCEQIGKKKHNLVKIDKAIEEDVEREKRHIENVAMEQLIQMAYKRRMACRRNNASKTVMRKVSKQVAMGFIERTLARCKNFELTGRSCFSEPALQNVMFAAPQSNDAGVNIATDVNGCIGAPKRRTDTVKADSISFSMLDSGDDMGRGSIESPQTTSHSSEHGFRKLEQGLHKGKKRELRLDDVGVASSRGTTAFGNSLVRGAKGKRTERDRDHGRGNQIAISASENQTVGRFRSEQKPKLKPQQNSASVVQPLLSSIQQQNTGSSRRGKEMGLSSSEKAPIDECEEAEDPLDFSRLPMPDFDSIEQLGISNDPSGTQDIGFWLDGLQEDGSEGLHIPMDDLSMIL